MRDCSSEAVAPQTVGLMIDLLVRAGQGLSRSASTTVLSYLQSVCPQLPMACLKTRTAQRTCANSTTAGTAVSGYSQFHTHGSFLFTPIATSRAGYILQKRKKFMLVTPTSWQQGINSCCMHLVHTVSYQPVLSEIQFKLGCCPDSGRREVQESSNGTNHWPLHS